MATSTDMIDEAVANVHALESEVQMRDGAVRALEADLNDAKSLIAMLQLTDEERVIRADIVTEGNKAFSKIATFADAELAIIDEEATSALAIARDEAHDRSRILQRALKAFFSALGGAGSDAAAATAAAKKDLAAAQRAKADAQADAKRLDAELKAAQAQLRDIEKAQTNDNKAKAAADKEAAARAAQAATDKAALDTLKAKTADLEKALADAKAAGKNKADDASKAAAKDLEKAKDEAKKAAKARADAEAEARRLADALKAAEAKAAALQKAKAAADGAAADVAKEQKATDALKKKVADLEKALAEAKGKVDGAAKLPKELAAKEKALEEAKGDLKKANKARDEAKTEAKRLGDALKAAEAEAAKAQEDAGAKAAKEQDKLKGQLDKERKEAGALRDQLGDLKSQLAEAKQLADAAAAAQDKASSLDAKAAEASKARDAAATQASDLRQALEQAQGALAAARQDNESTRGECDALRDQLAAAEAAADELRRRADALDKELAAAKNDFDEAEAARQAAEMDLGDKESELARALLEADGKSGTASALGLDLKDAKALIAMLQLTDEERVARAAVVDETNKNFTRIAKWADAEINLFDDEAASALAIARDEATERAKMMTKIARMLSLLLSTTAFELDRARQDLAAAKEDAAAAKEAEAAKAALAAAQGEVEKLTADRDALAEQLAAVQKALTDAEKRAADLEKQLEDALVALAAKSKALAGAEREIDQLKKLVGGLEADKTDLQKELDELRDLADADADGAVKARADAAAAEARLAALEKDLSDAKALIAMLQLTDEERVARGEVVGECNKEFSQIAKWADAEINLFDDEAASALAIARDEASDWARVMGRIAKMLAALLGDALDDLAARGADGDAARRKLEQLAADLAAAQRAAALAALAAEMAEAEAEARRAIEAEEALARAELAARALRVAAAAAADADGKIPADVAQRLVDAAGRMLAEAEGAARRLLGDAQGDQREMAKDANRAGRKAIEDAAAAAAALAEAEARAQRLAAALAAAQLAALLAEERAERFAVALEEAEMRARMERVAAHALRALDRAAADSTAAALAKRVADAEDEAKRALAEAARRELLAAVQLQEMTARRYVEAAEAAAALDLALWAKKKRLAIADDALRQALLDHEAKLRELRDALDAEAARNMAAAGTNDFSHRAALLQAEETISRRSIENTHLEFLLAAMQLLFGTTQDELMGQMLADEEAHQAEIDQMREAAEDAEDRLQSELISLRSALFELRASSKAGWTENGALRNALTNPDQATVAVVQDLDGGETNAAHVAFLGNSVTAARAGQSFAGGASMRRGGGAAASMLSRPRAGTSTLDAAAVAGETSHGASFAGMPMMRSRAQIDVDVESHGESSESSTEYIHQVEARRRTGSVVMAKRSHSPSSFAAGSMAGKPRSLEQLRSESVRMPKQKAGSMARRPSTSMFVVSPALSKGPGQQRQ